MLWKDLYVSSTVSSYSFMFFLFLFLYFSFVSKASKLSKSIRTLQLDKIPVIKKATYETLAEEENTCFQSITKYSI